MTGVSYLSNKGAKLVLHQTVNMIFNALNLRNIITLYVPSMTCLKCTIVGFFLLMKFQTVSCITADTEVCFHGTGALNGFIFFTKMFTASPSRNSLLFF